MKLKPYVTTDPTERTVRRLFDRKLDEAVTASGLGEIVRESISCRVSDIIAHSFHDLIEPVASVAPRTGNLVVRLRVSDRLDRAFATATENLNILLHSSNTLH